MRYAEALGGRGLQERPGESLARRVRYRVHEDIELTPFAPEQLEGDIALGIDRDVERHGEARSKRMRERLDALFHLVVDVGEGELGSLPVHRLRDAPRNGAFGRNPDDEGAFAGEKSHLESSRRGLCRKSRRRGPSSASAVARMQMDAQLLPGVEP